MSRAWLAAAFLAAPLALFGYTRGVDLPGEPDARRGDAENMAFIIDSSVRPGQTNASGDTIVTPDSDPAAAVRAAAERWNRIPDSRVNFNQFTANESSVAQDGRNVITMRDDPTTRSIVGSATAVTSFFVVLSTNTIVESDIVFNPEVRDEEGTLIPFSTTGQPGTFDVEATMAHEFGHAIGAKHSSVAGATMWQNGREGELFARTLTPDDEMFAIQAYPQPSAAGNFGRIRGTARLQGGSPIRGGLVAAVNPNGTVVSALTDLVTGVYDILVPPGQYLVYVDPANDPLGAQGLTIGPQFLDIAFATTLLGGNDTPTTVAVTAGGTATADLTAPVGAPPLEIQYVGVRESDDFIVIGTGPRELPLNRPTELFLWGAGLASVVESEVRLLGPRAALVPGSVRVSSNLVFQGLPALRLTIQPTAAAHPTQAVDGGSLATILITRQGTAAAYTGGVVLESLRAPAFSSGSVTNAASFAAGPVAPGEIVSIFGTDLGPAAGVASPGFDAQGRLATTLAAVEVTFDGTPAPLFFVSAGQINAQVPYEVAGRASTTAVVHHQRGFSAAVSLPVAAAAPGIFFLAPNVPAIVNQNGSANSPGNPEARGRALVVFATGQGVVSDPVPTGAPARSSPLSGVAEASATIGGRPAQVLFAGLAPGYVGLMQANLLIPNDAPAGAQPVVLTIRGQRTQAGVLASIAP